MIMILCAPNDWAVASRMMDQMMVGKIVVNDLLREGEPRFGVDEWIYSRRFAGENATVKELFEFFDREKRSYDLSRR